MINKKTKNIFIKVNNFLFTFIAFLLPLQKELVTLAIVLFFITSIVLGDLKNFSIRGKKSIPLYIYFIISVLALSFTENISIGLHKIETQLSFFALPFAVAISNINIKELSPKISKSFIQGCLLAIVIGVINSVFLYLNTQSLDSFFYNNLAVYTHNSHFAMYLNLALIFLYRSIVKSRKTNYLNLFIAIVFNVTIIALISKTGIITLLLTNLIFSYFLIQKKSYFFSLLIFSFFISSAVVLYSNSSIISKRINEFTTSIFTEESPQQETSTSSRIKVLKTSFKLIKEKPIIGYGIGDVQAELNKEYANQNYILLKKRNLNTHNMYLQRLLSTGLIGFGSLILLLVHPLFILKKRSKTLWFFIALISINIATEAMFIKREGIIFFVFFILYFLFNKESNNQNSENKKFKIS